jgi:hypothetical protein
MKALSVFRAAASRRVMGDRAFEQAGFHCRSQIQDLVGRSRRHRAAHRPWGLKTPNGRFWIGNSA